MLSTLFPDVKRKERESLIKDAEKKSKLKSYADSDDEGQDIEASPSPHSIPKKDEKRSVNWHFKRSVSYHLYSCPFVSWKLFTPGAT